MEAAPLTADALLRHEAFVLRLARSLVRNEASAEDIAQETLLSALEHRPHPAGLRSWLARVTRHRALDHLRGEQRRSDRELRAARGEAIETGPSAHERLELEHKVVSAVLALDEPYRSVVIAAYYEGLAPDEIARRRRAAPGTVRSQLSRALEQLRAKLDRNFGDRTSWSAILFGLLGEHGSRGAAAATLSSSATLSWPLVACSTIAAATLLWLGVRGLSDSSSGVPSLAAPLPGAALPVPDPDPVQAPVPDVNLHRAAVAAAPQLDQDKPSSSSTPSVSDLPSILERSRALKAALLRRRLEVEPQVRERFAWLERLPGTGIIRLIDRTVFGFDLDLPGMDGGGSFYSFTARVHDYQSSPQLALEQGRLRSEIYGQEQGAVLDLGSIELTTIDLADAPSSLDERHRSAWRLLTSPAEEMELDTPRWLEDRIEEIGFRPDQELRDGHCYLLRAVYPREFDVLVAFQVASVGDQDCTIAWRILESRLITAKYSGVTTLPAKAMLDSVSPELLSKPEPDLRAELDELRGQAEFALLESYPRELSRRFAELLSRKEAGLARLIAQGSPWSELPRVREGGSCYSFATRSHSYDDFADIALVYGRLASQGSGASLGLILDLGQVALEDAAVNWSRLGRGPAFELAANGRIDYSRPREAIIDEMRGLQKQVNGLRASSTEALLGHSYLVRSIQQGHHDLLVVVEVAAIDEYGVWIAWQQVASWPVPQDR